MYSDAWRLVGGARLDSIPRLILDDDAGAAPVTPVVPVQAVAPQRF
jgi:hypothetical protein